MVFPHVRYALILLSLRPNTPTGRLRPTETLGWGFSVSGTERVIFRKPAPPYKLDADDVQALNLKLCPFCGCYHLGLCPRVIEIEYHENGGVARAVLREHWDTSMTTWPWELAKES